MVVKIALRNIVRHKRRTLLSAITIGVGMMFFIFMNSMMAGMDLGMIDNMVHLGSGALRITTSAYEAERQTFPLDHGIENVSELYAMLEKDNRIRGVTGRTRFLGQLSNYEEMMPVVGTVIDPATDTTVFALHTSLTGRFFGDQASREIILGSRLAREMGVGLGDHITLFAHTRYDSRNADEFEIVGLINSTDPALNKAGAIITRDAADDFLDLGGLVTEVAIAVARGTNLKAFMKQVNRLDHELEARLPAMAVSSFIEIGAAFFEISKTKSMFGMIFLLVILLIAAVGIFNTVFMSVYERIREIGVLRAHGMKSGEISRLFVLEGVITGIAGSLLGLVLGSAVTLYLTTAGFPMDRIAGDVDMGDFPFWGTVYGTWEVGVMVGIALFAVLVATLAGVVPARSAGRMSVTRALRFN